MRLAPLEACEIEPGSGVLSRFAIRPRALGACLQIDRPFEESVHLHWPAAGQRRSKAQGTARLKSMQKEALAFMRQRLWSSRKLLSSSASASPRPPMPVTKTKVTRRVVAFTSAHQVCERFHMASGASIKPCLEETLASDTS